MLSFSPGRLPSSVRYGFNQLIVSIDDFVDSLVFPAPEGAEIRMSNFIFDVLYLSRICSTATFQVYCLLAQFGCVGFRTQSIAFD